MVKVHYVPTVSDFNDTVIKAAAIIAILFPFLLAFYLSCLQLATNVLPYPTGT